MTKTAFYAAYRAALLKHYEWANKDPKKLNRYLESVTGTIQYQSETWNCDVTAPAIKEAWKAIGGKGKLSLRKLRELPL
jgi:hypothetical protein